MTTHVETLQLVTRGRGTQPLHREVAGVVARSGVAVGLCHVFVAHTSASVILCENADPDVRADLERWLARAVPDGDRAFVHTMEGPDDMPAHVRTVLTGSALNLPVEGGRLALGAWQGIYLYEHRQSGHERRVRVTVQGQASA